MSKTKTKRKNSHRVPVYRRPWIVVIFFLAMAAAVVIALLFIRPNTVTPTPQSSNPPSSTPATSTPATPAVEETPVAPETPTEPEDKTTQYEGEDPNTLEQLTGYLTRKGVDDDILTVTAVIDQYLQSPGHCTIILKNSVGQTVYSVSRNAVPEVTTSICDTFEIPVAGFPHGVYQIEIDLSGAQKQGTIIDEVEL